MTLDDLREGMIPWRHGFYFYRWLAPTALVHLGVLEEFGCTHPNDCSDKTDEIARLLAAGEVHAIKPWKDGERVNSNVNLQLGLKVVSG
jgi:hypothetical protein